jgi:nitroreductase
MGTRALDWPQADIARCVGNVLRARKAVRAFRPDPLGRELVHDILAEASTAPSGANIQPWRVYVLAGAPLKELGDALLASARSGSAPPPAHFPDPLPDVFRTRLQDFGGRLYGSLGIERHDAPARARQAERNLFFFGAPVGLIFSIDRRLKPHSWIDLGLFAQNLMIAAKSRGVDTCPQVSFAPFHDTKAAQLQIPPEEVTALGMSMGYGDPAAAVNQVRMPRERVEDFARMLGFQGRAVSSQALTTAA